MKKLLLGLILVLIFPLSAHGAVYLHGEEIPTVFMNNQNYISRNQLGLFNIEINDSRDFIPLREAAKDLHFYIKNGDVYITEKPAVNRTTLAITNQGSVLEAVYFEPKDYTQTVLAVFALHGYEDWYPRDGQILVDTANAVIEEFTNNPELMKDTRYIIVPCANPDGLLYGYTENGYGRCNSDGIDLNRDFDYNWDRIDYPRWKTGDAPFSAIESQALRDLVLLTQPDIVFDFHGWLDCVYTKNMDGELIRSKLKLGHPKPALPGFKESQGYFYAWAGQYAKSALIEFRQGKTVEQYKNDALAILTYPW